MSIWKEIRCDAILSSDDCYSNRNQGPQGFTTIIALHREARAQGWKISRGMATCPACQGKK